MYYYNIMQTCTVTLFNNMSFINYGSFDLVLEINCTCMILYVICVHDIVSLVKTQFRAHL